MVESLKLSLQEKKILSELYNEFRSKGAWQGVKTIHEKFGKSSLEGLLCRKPLLIWVEEKSSEGRSFYVLTFEGISVTSRGRKDLKLLERYLELLIKAFKVNPEVQEVTSSRVAEELSIDKEELKVLRDLINIGHFWGKTFNGTVDRWAVGLPDDIEDLVRLGSREYISQHRRKFLNVKMGSLCFEYPELSAVDASFCKMTFNDSPIGDPKEDRFGINPFAKTIAHNICHLKKPVGVTLAINGVWGSGKSSAVNLIRYYLKDNEESNDIKVIEFKCWWFKGEEGLALAFLQELNRVLQDSLSKKAKDVVPSIARILLQGGEVVGPAVNMATGGVWGSVAAGGMGFIKKFFSDQGVEDLFKQLSKELESKNKRYLIIVDDIDRLDPPEVLMVFRLIKSIGRLPNVIYLLSFDRELAEKTVREKYPSEGPHFLEKIIQVGFDLPLPVRDDLNHALLQHIEEICGVPKEKDDVLRFMNVFYDVVAPYVNLPRDMVKLCNSVSVGWGAVAEEVNVADFIGLDALRIFEPKLYNKIRMSKDVVCAFGNRGSRDDERINPFLDCVEAERRDQVKDALLRLFPAFENVGYSADFVTKWERERRLCTERHFNTYFRMSIGDESFAKSEIDSFIDNCVDKDYVKQFVKDAFSFIRRNGKSRVPLLLDDLNANADKIGKEKVETLICGLFEVADDIDRDADQEGGMGIADNRLRIHWLVRKLLFDKCTLSERDKILREGLKEAALAWKASFVVSAVEDYYPEEGKPAEPEEKCFILRDSVEYFRNDLIKSISEAAESGDLIKHPRLGHIIFRWRDIVGDGGSQAKEWTKRMLNDDEALPFLAKAFTSHSWSQGLGMFGLGDRVAVRKVRAGIDGLDDVIDKERFRQRLNEVKDSETLTKEQREDIQVFLDAWAEREDPDGDME